MGFPLLSNHVHNREDDHPNRVDEVPIHRQDLHALGVLALAPASAQNSGRYVGVNGGLTGVNIENCEIVGAGTAGPEGSMGIYVEGDSQVTINAINMHDVGQGVDVNDGQVTLENS